MTDAPWITMTDWSGLPDVYVIKAECQQGMFWRIEACSVPMAIGPEVRLVRADIHAAALDKIERLEKANLIYKLGLEDIGICGTLPPKNQKLMESWHERVAQSMRDQSHDVLQRAHAAALSTGEG